MDGTKKLNLESGEWRINTNARLLDVTEEEQEYIEVKLALARKLREQRQKNRLTQVQAARLLQSSQSRVAKMEAGDPTVSLDLLIRSLIALGASRQELARMIATPSR